VLEKLARKTVPAMSPICQKAKAVRRPGKTGCAV